MNRRITIFMYLENVFLETCACTCSMPLLFHFNPIKKVPVWFAIPLKHCAVFVQKYLSSILCNVVFSQGVPAYCAPFAALSWLA